MTPESRRCCFVYLFVSARRLIALSFLIGLLFVGFEPVAAFACPNDRLVSSHGLQDEPFSAGNRSWPRMSLEVSQRSDRYGGSAHDRPSICSCCCQTCNSCVDANRVVLTPMWLRRHEVVFLTFFALSRANSPLFKPPRSAS